MIAAPALQALILNAFPDAEVQLTDLTGGQDHWQALIVSPRFAGLGPVQRHRLVYQALAEEMKGPIHALSLTVLAPGEPRPR